MDENKVKELHKHLKVLLDNNIDFAISDECLKELQQLDMFFQWMEY